MSNLTNEKNVAIEAVLKSCYLAQTIQKALNTQQIFSKNDLSPVSIADYSAQVIINEALHKNFPNDELMGEETAILIQNTPDFISLIVDSLKKFKPFTHSEILNLLEKGQGQGGKNKRFWAIDPIDGTKGFLRNDQYAIAVSLIENGYPILGILGCPNLEYKNSLGVLLVAVRDQGCFAYTLEHSDETKLLVSQNQKSTNLIYCEPNRQSQTHSHSKAAQIAHELKADPHPFQMDSQCKYSLLALGKASIYLRLPEHSFHSSHGKEKVWDHAAGTIVVEEAGGKVTDALGMPLDFSTGQSLLNNIGVIATNGKIHKEVIEISKRLFS